MSEFRRRLMMMQGIKKDNSITAVYNNWGIGNKTIFNKDYLSYIYKMTVNGMEITPTYEYNAGRNDFTVTMWFSQPLTDMTSFFYYIPSIRSIDFSNFISNKLTNIRSLCNYCERLTTINFKNFNTPSLLRMDSMFYGCRALTSLDLSSFDTRNVTNISDLFGYCRALTSLDLSSFNTSNVTRMDDMFAYCRALTSLDLSSFNTSNVVNMNHMFEEDTNINSPILVRSEEDKIRFETLATNTPANITFRVK